MDSESIYRYITRMADNNPGLPYSFQGKFTGREDVSHVIWGKPSPYTVREEWARELVDLIPPCMESQLPSELLSYQLEARPIYAFLPNLSSRLNLFLQEEMVDSQQLYGFGIQLATASAKDDEVKLGMIILGQFENDVTTRILRILGLHSSLTLYALEASRNFRHRNQFVFDLARHTTGFGKVAALHILEPIKPEQQEWVFNHGADNPVAFNISAMTCLDKVDMAECYLNLELTETNFSRLSQILAYALEHNQAGGSAVRIMLVEKYITVAGLYARSFIDLAALVVIQGSLEHGLNTVRVGELRATCHKIIHQLNWRKIIAKEVAFPSQQTSLILLILKETRTLPTLKEMIPLLHRDPFDLDMLRFFLIDNPKEYLNDIYDYLQAVLPEEVRKDDPQNIATGNITTRNKPDVWLCYLLKALRKVKRYDEALFIQGLTCRYTEVRIEAARCLRGGFTHWSDAVLPALEHASLQEPVKEIQHRLKRILDKARGGRMTRNSISTAGLMVDPSPEDISLLITNIAGTSHHDLTALDGDLVEGDDLCLVREADNEFDEKAILVATTAGNILGYIPRVYSPLLAALMDGGERLYAVLGSFDLIKGYIKIELRLSKREIENAGTAPC